VARTRAVYYRNSCGTEPVDEFVQALPPERAAKIDDFAAHIRERRYELDLTQQEVARRAGTSHSFISKLESGEHLPTIPVLNRILAVLDEQLLIGIERNTPGQEPEREVAPAPQSMSA
jgi:DNA-binding XRE family transcriptional regulator